MYNYSFTYVLLTTTGKIDQFTLEFQDDNPNLTNKEIIKDLMSLNVIEGTQGFYNTKNIERLNPVSLEKV